MQVCFIGHREIEKNDTLVALLEDTIVSLISNGATTFLFGSMSAFDDLAWEIVTKLKKEYIFIKRVYVRASSPYISKEYENFLLNSFEETYFPEKIINAGKLSYVERNFSMIDNSTFCIFYYNESYTPKPRRITKVSAYLPTKNKSGTKIAYLYAQKKNKHIINLYTLLSKN